MDTPKTFLLTVPAGQLVSNAEDLGEDGFRGSMTFTLWTPIIAAQALIETCGPLGNFCTLQASGQDIVIGSRKATQVIVLNASKVQVRITQIEAQDKGFEFVWNTVARL